MLEWLANGLLGWTVLGLLLIGFVLTHVTLLSVTLYLHRCQAHRALDMHPLLSHGFRFWLWLTTAMNTKEWVAIHRKHHAFCETEQDPHSPQVMGIQTILRRGAEVYAHAALDQDMVAKYGRQTPDDWVERHIYSRYPSGGVALMLVINLTLFGAIGLTLWAAQMALIPILAAGVINGLGHYWGYRNFTTDDASTNLTPWGLWIGGEELHNNHHAFPSSACFAQKPWELDIGWCYLKFFAFIKLVRIKKVARRPVTSPTEQPVSLETLTAVVNQRLHVIRDYTRLVLAPTLQQEWAKADGQRRRWLKRTRRTLIRNKRLTLKRQKQLEQALASSATFESVHQYMQQLQAIWNRTTASHEQLIAALQEWCNQAEASGIETLQNFSMRLRGYQLARA